MKKQIGPVQLKLQKKQKINQFTILYNGDIYLPKITRHHFMII